MEQYGNTTTYNIENVLYQNIIQSEYYTKTCMKMETWEAIVDEIFYNVSDVEPWMSGNARGASSTYCLLYRLGTLEISELQVKDLLDHVDSPYIRAVGFLYLRYVGNPKTFWAWIQPYVRDSEEFTPSPAGDGKTVTIGDFVRDIFLEQYYFETIFPRIPKPVADDLISKLTSMGLPIKAQRNGGQGGPDRRGVEEPNRRPASVKASLSVAFGQRAPNRASAREEGRGLGAGLKGASGQGRFDQDMSRSERERSRDRDRAKERNRDRDRPREADRRDRDRERERDRDRERDRLKAADRHRDRDRERDRDRPREADRERDRKREREHDRDRDGRDDKRSRDRDARDVFREKTAGAPKLDRVREAYGDANAKSNGRSRD